MMQPLKTIKKVFQENLRRLRGDRTQAELAELAGIPFRTYQEAERTGIPHGPTLAAIAKAFGVNEVALFQDKDAEQELTEKLTTISPMAAWEIVGRALKLNTSPQVLKLPKDLIEDLNKLVELNEGSINDVKIAVKSAISTHESLNKAKLAAAGKKKLSSEP